MPLIKAAKKALRQNARRKIRNLERKKEMKNLIKKIKEFSAQGKRKEAQELIPSASKAIDKAAKAGIIKDNTASRKKSGIVRLADVATQR